MIYCDTGNHYLLVSRGIIFGIPAAAMAGSVLFLEKEIDRNNSAIRFVVEVGEASYVMYLTHCLVIVFFAKAVFKDTSGTNCAFIYEIVKIIIIILATTAVSILIHRFIDTPIQRYLKRR
jgi:peptidoglycan/LPS O-acetylase OafA/YrhL